jgi:hypothetical protein
VVQADIGLAVEGHGVVGIGDAPNGEGDTAVGDEHGRIRVIPGYFLETESSTEEARGLVEIANGKTDVVHAVGQSVGQNSILSSWVMIEGRLMDVPSEEVRPRLRQSWQWVARAQVCQSSRKAIGGLLCVFDQRLSYPSAMAA